MLPGCPAHAYGTVSECQSRRARWAAELSHAGSVDNFVTSGAAVYTPHVEAEALALAMVHLGVPADRIVLETQARHTDENAAYRQRIIEKALFDR